MFDQLMNSEAQVSEQQTPSVEIERRRHSRYRYIKRLYVGKQDGMWYTAMTFEISVGGLSAATAAELVAGELVNLSPVGGKRIRAIVRRKQGAMYGFEFLDLGEETEEQIRKLCEGWPLFKNLSNS
jgi:hypothetical protein